MPRLLYLADFLPGADSGGALVIERHLRRLSRAGWEVTVSVPVPATGHRDADMHFFQRPLPRRKWWWPPAKTRWPSSMRLRSTLWARSIIDDPCWIQRPDVVLTVLWGPASRSAALASTAWRTPLAVIVHDLFRETSMSPAAARAAAKLEKEVLASADRVWPVSDEMSRALIPLARAGTVRTLAPVPDDYSTLKPWQPKFSSAPVIAHAGALHVHHVEYLANIARAASRHGGGLLVVASGNNPALACLRDRGIYFQHQPAFPTSREALAFLSKSASALTVMYPFNREAYPYPPTGFPSRVLEFSHLGLPMILAAPPGNPLHSWAQRQRWPLLIENDSPELIANSVAQIANENKWLALSTMMRAIASSVCDPEKIHRQFLTELPSR